MTVTPRPDPPFAGARYLLIAYRLPPIARKHA